MTGIVCAIVGNSVVTAVAEVIRRKNSVIAAGNAQVDTARSKFGGASVLFDGTGDYLKVVNDGRFDFGTEDFTIEWWQYLTSLDRWAIDMRGGSNGPNILIYSWPSDGSANELYYYVNSSNRISATSVISTDVWQHIAVSRSGTSTKMFVDGTQVGSTWTDTTDYNNGDLLIWENSLSTPFPTGLYNAPGNVDEFRISNSARYTANFTPSTTAFVNDENTLLLIHCDGTDASTYFEDDNGQRASVGISAIADAQIDTAQSKFGGSSALFDGTDDYLKSGNPIIPATSDFTIEFWVRPAATGVRYDCVGNNETNIGRLVTNTTTGNLFQFFIGDSVLGNFLLSSSSTYSAGTWYHFAVSRSGNNFYLFKDGTLEASGLNTANYSISQKDLIIGWRPGASNYLNGHIDEVRISNTARYTATFTPSTTQFVNDSNTLLLLHMDGTDGSTVFRDDNGVRARVGVSAIGNAQIDTAQSKFGGSSAMFDGTGDYLVCSGDFADLIDDGDFTIECWAYIEDAGIGYILSNRRSTFGSFGWVLTHRGDLAGDPTQFTLNGYSGIADTTLTGTTTLNAWHHFAIVKDGNTVTYYIDGTSVDSLSVSGGSYAAAGSNEFRIGSNSDSAADFDGYVDEVRISNIARYTANFTPSTTAFQNDSNTLLLLHMDGTDGSTVFTDDNGVTPSHEYS